MNKYCKLYGFTVFDDEWEIEKFCVKGLVQGLEVYVLKLASNMLERQDARSWL